MRAAGDRPDARPVPSIAEQLRADRHRRVRRRRAALAASVAVPAALLAAHLGGDATVAPASATSATSASASSTSSDDTATAAPSALQSGLVDAFGRAQADAAGSGYHLTITSGFRTAAEQAALLDAEVVERGSLEEAQRWVFPPDRSMHVQGLAIDVGDGPAADWLAEGGAAYGLCRTLSWEWWHFEWRERWEAAGACPSPAAGPEEAPPA